MKNSTRTIRLLLFKITFVFIGLLNVQSQELPWLKYMDPSNKIGQIDRVLAACDVETEDLSFKTIAFYNGPKEVVYRQTLNDRMVTRTIEGDEIWIYEGQGRSSGSDFFFGFILGHQLHAQLLFFDQLNDDITAPTSAEYQGTSYQMISGQKNGITFKVFYTDEGQPIAIERAQQNALITFDFSDWRMESGMLLPFETLIDDQRRVFDYQFTSVEFNKGSLTDFKPDK